MSTIRLVIGRRTQIPVKPARPVFTLTGLSHSYIPVRGLPYSILIHAILLLAILILPPIRTTREAPRVEERIVMIDLRDPDAMMYLPLLLDEAPAEAPKTINSEPRPKKFLPAPAPVVPGLSYPGPQLIISDVPEPTNSIQTLLQPALENPPVLKPPLSLPNIVQIAGIDSSMEAPPDPIETQPQEIKAEVPPQEPPAPKQEVKSADPPLLPIEIAPRKPIELPKPELVADIPVPSPVPIPELQPKIVVPKPVIMEKPVLEASIPKPEDPPEKPIKPAAEPKKEPPLKSMEASKKPAAAKSPTPPQNAEQPKSSPATQVPAPPSPKTNLLALTPMPAPSSQPVKIPAGEARGRFIISPEPNISVSEKEPGARIDKPSNETRIASSPSSPTPLNAIVGKDKNAANGTAAAAKQGNPVEMASVSEAGNGAGTGGGSKKGAFAGITIVGGVPDDGGGDVYEDEDPPETPPRPLQTSYGLNIISTEDSGGGLPFVGVFTHEQIYTVYLDMRQAETDRDLSWTLEFSPIKENAGRSDAAGNQQGLILPFPITKQRPALPAPLVQKYSGSMIIVYAVISVEGKMEQLKIMESPDTQFNAPVLKALSQWVFRPAQLDGAAIPAKTLLGIPLRRP